MFCSEKLVSQKKDKKSNHNKNPNMYLVSVVMTMIGVTEGRIQTSVLVMQFVSALPIKIHLRAAVGLALSTM